eukprot:scaffold187015_cov40-Attheya_sp.AAC.1
MQKDRKMNHHRMFKKRQNALYLDEVENGPWIRHFPVMSVVGADFDNNDGYDDMFVAIEKDNPMIFLQDEHGGWTSTQINQHASFKNVTAARVTHVTRDNVPDLIFVTNQNQLTRDSWFMFLLICGVFNINGDGWPDIYVVQNKKANSESYCGMPFGKLRKKYFNGLDQQKKMPNFVAPKDQAKDMLLVGMEDSKSYQ